MARNIYDKKQIERLLGKFMDGVSTLDEERLLADFFRSAEDIPVEWEDYREMFARFESGDFDIIDNVESIGKTEKPAKTIPLFRWVAAACVAAIAVMAGIYFSAQDKKEAYAEVHEATPSSANPHTDVWDYRKNSGSATNPQPKSYVKKIVAKGINAKKSARVTTPSATLYQDPDIDEAALQLQQARIDDCVAEAMAETYLAEYYAQQLANGEAMATPAVNLCLGDDYIPQSNIMTLVMQ